MGKEQAAKTGEFLASSIDTNKMGSLEFSPLQRAETTASIIKGFLKIRFPCYTNEKIKEDSAVSKLYVN